MDIIYIEFETTLNEANLLAEELQRYLEDNYDIKVKREKENDNTMDLGSWLKIFLDSAGVVALIKAAQAVLTKHGGVKITIRDKDKEVKASGLSAKAVAQFMEDAKKILDSANK